jgi:hypothetical protein
LLEHGYPSLIRRFRGGRTSRMTFNYIGDDADALVRARAAKLCTHQGYVGDGPHHTAARKLTGKRDTTVICGAGPWLGKPGFRRALAVGQPAGIVNEARASAGHGVGRRTPDFLSHVEISI